MDIKRLIFEIQKEIIKSEVLNIDEGGCGFFAYFVSLELTKYGIDHKIIFCDSEFTLEDKKTNLSKEKPDSYVAGFDHCWILCDVYKFDHESSGQDLEKRWEKPDFKFRDEIDLKSLKQTLRIASWNKIYNKGNNKQLRQIIKSAFLTMATLSKISIL